MHRLNPKYIRIAVITVVSLLVIFFIAGAVAYSKREALLQKVISKAKAKAKRDYNLDVTIGSAHFTGLSTVAFTNISVVPYQRDSLVHINKFDVSVKLMPLILGDVKLADVNLADGYLKFTSHNGVRNFDFLFKKKKDSTETKSKVDLSELANNLVNGVLYKIPDNLNLKNFNISFADDSNRVMLNMPTARIEDGKLNSTIEVNNRESIWHLDGTMHPSDKNIDVKFYADGKKVEFPFIEQKFKLKLNFDTLTTQLKKVEHSSGETHIYAYSSIRNLLVNHKALAANDIVVPNGSIDADFFVGENFVSVDSSSTIKIKDLTAHPFIKYTLRPNKIYELKINTGWIDAQSMFSSFPQGMFESLEGMQVAGKLNYKLNFYLDTKDPDNVQFDSRLSKDNFRIISYGKTDFSKLNHEFVYTPYEKGKPMPSRVIGPSNPRFTPLESISPDLRNAVMTAEDPSFFRHHGFVEESIRKSIATDFKEKKFKRGGSTISMQLVKNAFLNRGKTLSRKIEETLIVWLIENNGIMTKNRMLEVYFNIIEWGRNVYGIGEASHYYFDKSPSELTLGESIYLASIVPNPKKGLYAFLSDGSLNPRLHGYFNLIGRLMAKNGLTQPDTNAYGFYTVRVKPSLRPAPTAVDTAKVESLMRPADDNDDAAGVPPNQQNDNEAEKTEKEVSKPGFFQRLFGKKDTTGKAAQDSADAAKKREKEAKKEQKRLEKERRKLLRERGY
ncbi:biosynthetic peptidoglycan transglycosylase [Mucilaginibacter sp. KACC 22063]|uniref:biosynthetic peptidoglycan transglycosylase n=1 Tax=Mucilaginibacter sp. KACC 22063 TaxID=3025666 RepID=UPI002365A65D|nr:biosynthetic peptidoglycan transglycosylase [Mucilaginibacter sp. KACC 22063]WDF55403.1 transglycosylase domain-containing protein [Mucilaginibacter sp. KACC 22063]